MPGITIVEASAGSGKTYELAKQYIRLLVSADNPSPGEILAVTFTNKASFEMKERVLGFLKKTALGLFDDPEEFERITGFPPRERRLAGERARYALDEIFRNYSLLRIQTIDSLLHSILETTPLELDLPARFTVKDEPVTDLKYALEKLINSAGENRRAKRIFLRFIDCFLNVEHRSGWFPKPNMLDAVFFMLSLLNSHGRGISRGEGERISRKRKELFEIMKRLREILPEGTKKTLGDMLNRMEGVEDVIPENIIRKTTVQEEFPVKKGFESPPAAERLWGKFRKLLRELCEAEALTAFNPYVDIFNLVLESLPQARKDSGAVFLQEINRLSAPVFENNFMDAGELFIRLASRFRHYMLDEFQDTSLLQFASLSRLIEEALASGGSLFCVGDKKQAIYRFRGGDFTLAGRLAARYGTYGSDIRKLSHNYRSQREVVLFNNAIFSRGNLLRFLSGLGEESLSSSDHEDILGVFDSAEQSWERRNDAGWATAEFIEAGTEEDKDDILRKKLIPLVRDASARLGAGNTAVLARSNTDAQKISGWLISAGISVSSERTLDIREHKLVRELTAFLKFLNFPPDDISFAAFIQGSIFTKAAGREPAGVRDLVCRRAREAGGAPLYVYFRKNLPEEWHSFMEKFFRTAGTVPLYESIREMVSAFKISEIFPGSHAFMMKLLEAVKNFEDEHEDACIRSFLKHLDSGKEDDFQIESAESDAVRVMTIHKAKGLEFESVTLPFFDISVRPARAGAIVDIGYEGIKLLRIPSRFTLASPALARSYAEEYKRSVIDELNIAYVALTRAKRELHLFLPEKKGGAKNTARLLVAGDAEHGEKSRTQPRDPPPPADRLKPEVPWNPPKFFDGRSGADELSKRRKLLSGREMHYILARAAASGGAIQAEAPGETASSEPAFEVPGGTAPPFRDPYFRKKFFAAPGETVFTEKEIVGADGRALRLDRLITGAEGARVIDFKTSVSPGDDAQVKEYVVAVKSIFPEKLVEGFLVCMTSGRTVKIHG